jgi:hypothetical protein
MKHTSSIVYREKKMLGFNVKSIWLLAILAMSLCHYQNVSGEDCENDIMAFNIECMIFMNKDLPKPINPNDRCCNVIRRANVPCVCKNGLSKKLSTYIHIPQTIFIYINVKFVNNIYMLIIFDPSIILKIIIEIIVIYI